MEPECEVQWAFRSITMNKASGGDGIPTELFQILKDYAVKVLYLIGQQIWKTQQWPQDWKRSVSIPIPMKGNPKECSNYCTLALHSSHMLAKECSKFSKPVFNSTWSMNCQMFKLDIEKAEDPEIKLPISIGSLKKQENSRKASTSLTTLKPLTVWITTNCGKVFKRWEYQTTYLLPEKSVCQSRSNS